MRPDLPICFVFLIISTTTSGSVEEELRKSIDLAMKCRSKEPPKEPVMAVAPARFVQIVVILHERFMTPLCGRPLNTPIDIRDERTWPFCVFGRCEQNVCLCAASFAGPKCANYTQKCWLLYCYLTSCHPVRQSLHCMCDPELYGTQVSTGIYWYNEGKSSAYRRPPKGWKDQPTGVIHFMNNSRINTGASNQQGSRNQSSAVKGQNVAKSDSKDSNGQRGSSQSQRPGTSVVKPVNGSSGPGSNGSGAKAEAVEKTDVEEALQELEEAPSTGAEASIARHVTLIALISVLLAT